MRSGTMEITTRVGCPLNCRACPQKLFVGRYLQKRPWEQNEASTGEQENHHFTGSGPAMEMSFENFRICLDKLPEDKQIDFSGFVEPQLNPDFVEMVRYTQSTGRPMTLFSTLVGMTKDSYCQIREIPFVNMVLHIPDGDENSHFVLSEEYLELLDLVIRDAMAGRFRIHKYSCHGPVHPLIADLVRESGIPVDSNLHDRAGNVEDGGEVMRRTHKGRIRCASGPELDRNVLLPDGTVVLCCMDFGMEYILGNLLMQSYKEILEGEALRELRLRMQSEKNGDCICRNCVIAENDFEHLKRILRTTIKR